MATIVKKAIRSTAGWTANQTAMEAIYGVGGYYTTLTSWEAAIPADLVAADEQWVAECYNDFPTGLADTVDIAGHTTDATRNIIVTALASERHNGVVDGGFRIKTATTFPFKVDCPYTEVSYIQVESTTTGGLSFTLKALGDYTTIDSVISISTGTNCASFYSYSGATYCAYMNCIAITSVGYGFRLLDLWSSIYNSTAVCDTGLYGFNVNNTHYLKNNVSVNFTTDYSTTPRTGSITNATHEGTTSHSFVSVTGVSMTDGVDFTAPSTGDYSIPSGSVLIDAGTDLSATFTTDITGITRG